MDEEDVKKDAKIPSIPYLKKGDKPFTNDDERTAFYKEKGFNPDFKEQSFNSYAYQYVSAADKLIQTIINLPDQEKYVIPIVFLYRHYIGLQLKSIIHGEYKNHKSYSVKVTHRIDVLWSQAKEILEPVLKQYRDNGMLAEMEAAEEFIKEFASVDKMSQSFRYPINLAGEPTLKGNLPLRNISYVNLRHIADKMASLDAFLGAAIWTLFAHQDAINRQHRNTTL